MSKPKQEVIGFPEQHLILKFNTNSTKVKIQVETEIQENKS